MAVYLTKSHKSVLHVWEMHTLWQVCLWNKDTVECTQRTEDKAVNSSFTLSSPRSDCATSERKAELYSPRKPSKPASVKSYEEVDSVKQNFLLTSFGNVCFLSSVHFLPKKLPVLAHNELLWCLYVARYPVLRTAQSAICFTSSRPFQANNNSISLGSI